MSFFERLKTEASVEWRAYTEHPFIAGLAGGTLPRRLFVTTSFRTIFSLSSLRAPTHSLSTNRLN